MKMAQIFGKKMTGTDSKTNAQTDNNRLGSLNDAVLSKDKQRLLKGGKGDFVITEDVVIQKP